MSLKEQIQQRKLRQTSNLIDEETKRAVVEYVKTVLGKRTSLFEAYANEKIEVIGKNISELLSDLQIERDATVKEIENKIVSVEVKKDNIISDCTRIVEEITDDTRKDLEDIISRIEDMRGPKGDNMTFDDLTKEQIQSLKGEDGSPDTPPEIAKKLNSTKESVKMSVIYGLKEKLEELKKSIKKGGGSKGGGMGNPQHESFALTDSTTSVMTQYSIAAGGNAIFTARYQGQALIFGTSYTVSGDNRTINLLFTPVNGTYFDITYVR